MTNGDKIRQMSDEGLIQHIACPYDACIDLNEPCNDCILKWLQSEVQEDG